jgi:1-deoxy-D-xylulose-5-phosphate synthase
MLYTAIHHQKGPIALRYPRGNAFGLPKKETFDLIPIGKAERVREGKDVAILAVGSMVHNAIGAAEQLAVRDIDAEVVNMRFAKPIDTEMVEAVARRFSTVVTVEENSIVGGFGSAVAAHIATLRGTKATVHVHGIPDEFVEQGSPAELHAITHLDAKGIAEVVGDALAKGQERG